MDWNWFTVVCAGVCAILFIGSFLPIRRGEPLLISALLLILVATVFAAICGPSQGGHFAALLCLLFGAGAFVFFNSSTIDLPPQARFLRLLAAACTAGVGALFLVFPVPLTTALARSAWFLAGFCALSVFCVALTRGQVQPPKPGRPADRLSPVSMVLDALGIMVSITLLLYVRLWPQADAEWVVLAWLVVFVASFLIPHVFWYLPSRPRQPLLFSTVWIGMAFVMMGIALGAEPATPGEAAASWLVIGIGFSIMAWLVLAFPLLARYFGLPQALATLVRRSPQPESPMEDGI